MPDETALPGTIEQRLEAEGYALYVEEARDTLVLTGVVGSEADREAVLDLVREVAPNARLDENITVADALPEETREATLSELEVGAFPGATGDLDERESAMPGDFTDQQRASSHWSVQPASPSGGARALLSDDEAVTEGDAVYTPPIDPVGTDRTVIGGFSASSMDDVEVARSSDGTLGDEAIAEAIRRGLREDAATTSLEIEVEVVQGVVMLRGEVEDLDDAESAEEVSARVPGVVEVIEQLHVRGLSEEEGAD